MQLMMDAHKENTEEREEDKEHDQDFKEMYQGVTKRSMSLLSVVLTEDVIFNLFIIID